MLDPQRTLALLLGASEWPRFGQRFASAQAFTNSAKAFSAYLRETSGLGLHSDNILNLFDDTAEVTSQYDCMADFLRMNFTRLDATAGREICILMYYVGHGAFFGPENAYCLLVRSTRPPIEADSSIKLSTMANLFRTLAPSSNRIVVLDSCFAGAAAATFQGSLEQATGAKTRSVIERGVAVMGAASARDPARLSPDTETTMFTESLLHVLHQGDASIDGPLTLRRTCDLVREVLMHRYRDDAPRPEVQSPDQRHGDLADMEFFPNPAAFVPEAKSQSTSDIWQSASYISVSVQWPDQEVRVTDRLDDSENYWVAYVMNSASIPIHNVVVTLLGHDLDESLYQVDFGTVDPGRREWFILRPDCRPEFGFDPSDERPDVWIDFSMRGYRWRLENGELALLQNQAGQKDS